MTQVALEQLIRDTYDVLRAQTLLANNGNRAPEFEFSSVGVKVTVWKQKEV